MPNTFLKWNTFIKNNLTFEIEQNLFEIDLIHFFIFQFNIIISKL